MSSANYQSEIIIQLRKEIDRLGHVLRASQSAALENQAEVFRLRAEIERLRAALEPLACTCDRPNGAACSRSEVDCPFWNARATLEGK
jgi:hypothetical protein